MRSRIHCARALACCVDTMQYVVYNMRSRFSAPLTQNDDAAEINGIPQLYETGRQESQQYAATLRATCSNILAHSALTKFIFTVTYLTLLQWNRIAYHIFASAGSRSWFLQLHHNCNTSTGTGELFAKERAHQEPWNLVSRFRNNKIPPANIQGYGGGQIVVVHILARPPHAAACYSAKALCAAATI